MDSSAPVPPPSRLRWRCRRGMRELDVLLRGFTAVDGAVERELVEVRGFTVVDRVLLELLGCTVGVRVVDRVLLMMGRLVSEASPEM